MYALLAISPIILAIALMVFFRVKSGKAMIAAWFLCVVFAAVFWKMGPIHLFAYTAYGFLVSIDTILIVFGAIFLLNGLINLGFIASIGYGFRSITQDRRIQILIIGWLFTCFLEGAAGFGSPGALAAPLLVGLGVPPFAAGLSALIGTSVPTTFGAVGTPPLTGFQTILPSIQAAFPHLEPAAFSSQLFTRMAFTNIFLGSLVPFMMIASIVARDGRKNGMRDAVAIWPLCLFAGLVFTVPVYIVVTFVGPEMGSLLGGLIAMLVFIPAVKGGFLVPKESYRFLHDTAMENAQVGKAGNDGYTAKAGNDGKNGKDGKPGVSLPLAWSPYVVIALILVASRLPWLPIRDWINDPSRSIVWRGIFGFSGIDWTWRYLNNPGLIPFVPVALGYMLCGGMNIRACTEVFAKTRKQTTNAVVALLFGIALVQVMRYTNYGSPGGGPEAMTTEVAKALAAAFGRLYPLVSPFVGAFGSIVAGSNTVANIMFMALQFEAALLVGLPTVLIAMSQSIGGAIGNMVCIHNVVAITATTQGEGKEGALLSAAVLPCLIYALLLSAALFIFLAIGLDWVA